MRLTKQELNLLNDVLKASDCKKIMYGNTSAYYFKHVVEKLFNHYISEEECIEDMKEIGVFCDKKKNFNLDLKKVKFFEKLIVPFDAICYMQTDKLFNLKIDEAQQIMEELEKEYNDKYISFNKMNIDLCNKLTKFSEINLDTITDEEFDRKELFILQLNALVDQYMKEEKIND